MTTPLLEWSDQLATGLTEVDDQHRRLVDIINSLGKLRADGASATELLPVFYDLHNYTLYHFKTEEDLMQTWSVDAANRAAHIKAHRGFSEMLERTGGLIASHPADVIDHLLAFLIKWLVHHIGGVDARMAKEIATLRAASPGSATAATHTALHDSLVDTVSELYDSLGSRTLEIIELNRRLEAELEQRRQTEESLRLASTVFNTVDEALVICDAEKRIVAINPAFTQTTGYAAAEAIGKNPRLLASGRQGAEFYREMWETLTSSGHWAGEIWNRRKSGEIYVERLSIKEVHDEHGKLSHYVGAFEDITERKAIDERILHLAHHDPLTDLPNRALFFDRVQQALAKARRESTGNNGKPRLALLYLDLDLFKQVNDTLGHAAGDMLLQKAARRMQACVRESDTVARLGGDEFALLLSIDEAQDALLVADKIRQALSLPFQISRQPVSITSSIGIALFPEHGSVEAQLTKRADDAMYRAKASGRNKVEIYSPAADPQVV